MLPISAVQAVVVVLANASDGAIAAAVIGGIFLIANTVITVILTKVLSKRDAANRRSRATQRREGTTSRLENYQGAGGWPDSNDDSSFDWPDDRSSESERESGRDPDESD